MVSRKSRSLKEWQKELSLALKPLIENSPREAQLLLMDHLGCDELYLLSHQDDILKDEEKLLEKLKRRLENEPLEYITNKVSFYGEEFFIDKGALIPRPETELLIDEVLQRVDREQPLQFVEVGVGSGIISIILAKHLPNASFIATDISQEALRIAQKNIEKFDLQDRIELHQTNLLDTLTCKIDYLVSNPPYIQDGVKLESNLSYEPQNALYGGDIGDEIIKALLDETLRREIRFFTCEMGYDQKDKISSYLLDKKYKKLEFYQDYSGFDRGFTLESK
ncbi:MAG: peptide chain release factor N(5)-glutamine methyltransferase [Epsilonproteobacteria bacterium]|nr:peptide chain release factor N(5)-glutamine methyltransferase [Campylobacterota bacterium]